MTNEEAIARIKNHKIAHKMNEPRAIYISEALDMAIKALEHEDILDKIRVEIERYKSTIDRAITEDELKIEGMKEAYTDCLEIIDKYKTESEEYRC